MLSVRAVAVALVGATSITAAASDPAEVKSSKSPKSSSSFSDTEIVGASVGVDIALAAGALNFATSNFFIVPGFWLIDDIPSVGCWACSCRMAAPMVACKTALSVSLNSETFSLKSSWQVRARWVSPLPQNKEANEPSFSPRKELQSGGNIAPINSFRPLSSTVLKNKNIICTKSI